MAGLPGLTRAESVPVPPPPTSTLVRARSERSDGGSGGGALRPFNRVAGALMPVQLAKPGGVPDEQLRELQCAACNSLIQSPVYAPCGHSFCHRHLSEGDTDGPTELDKTAEALRALCLEHGIPERRARETLLLTGSEDVAKAAEVCRQTGGLEGRAVKVHHDVSQPEFQWGKVTKDSVGKVVRIEGGHASVDFPEQRRWHGLARELEVEPVADQIKVGSVVCVRPGIRPSMGWGALEGDEVGTVVHVNTVNLVIEARGNVWFGFLGEVEPAPEDLDAELGEPLVPPAALKAAVDRLEASKPSETCRAVLAMVLKEAMAKGSTPFRIMLRGQKRAAVMTTRGAMAFLRLAGFRIVKVDNFRTRTLLESDSRHLVNRSDALLKALEAKLGPSPAVSDEEDMRYKVVISVDKPMAKRSATEFDQLWEEELDGLLKPALAPPQSVWSWPRRGWKNEEEFKESLAANLRSGSAVVAQGQTKQHARQVCSVLESKGVAVRVEESGKVSGEAAAVGEEITEITVPLAWEGDIPHHARVRLKDLEEGNVLSSVGTALVGIVACQYMTQDGMVYIVNFPKNSGKHVAGKHLELVASTDSIKPGARVKVRGTAEPFFGWGGVEGSDLGIVHNVLFDGAVVVYFPQLDNMWMGTLDGLTTENLPKVVKGNCPICLEPLARGEHLGTDMAVQAQVERIRRLMDGSRVERNDAFGADASATPKLVRTKTHEGEMTCSICMDLLVSPVTLACGHSFCKAHIEAWLLQHDSCPNCKHRVVAERLYKRKAPAPRAALFDAEVKDMEQAQSVGGNQEEAQQRGGQRGDGSQEWPEIPVNQMLESQLVRHFAKELSDRKAEIADEVWEALQQRSSDYLQRLRGFLRQFGEIAVQQIADKGFTDLDAKLPGTRGGTLLMLAAEQGVTAAVRELLKRGADPLAVLNAEGDVGATALSLAAARGHLETLKELLGAVEWPVVRIADALASAIEQRQRESMDFLLEQHATAAELSNSYGFPALITAVQTNSKDLLASLLQRGAKLEATVGSGILVTGGGKAQVNGVYQLAGTFEGKSYYQNSNGAAIYCKGWWKMGTFSLKKEGATHGWYYSMPEPRIECDAPPAGKWTTHGYDGIDAVPPPSVQHLDSESGAVVSPLLLAVQLGFVEVAQQLIDAGADARARVPSSGSDLLQVACVGGDVGMVKLLLGAKAAVTSTDDLGHTPLHTAAAAGHHLVVKELLQAGAAVEAEEMPTPLVLASCCGSYPPGPGRVWQVSVAEKYELVVEQLLAARADPLRTAPDGSSVLHVAARAGASAAAIAALIAAGARPDLSDAGGRSPFFAALHAGRSASARALVEHMGPSDSMLKFEFQSLTPLAAASLLGDAKLVAAVLGKLQQQGQDRSWLDASVNAQQPPSGDLMRVVSTGFDTDFWQLVHEPLPSTVSGAAAEAAASLEVGDRVVLAVDYEGKGYAARGPLRPGDVGQIVKKDKGAAPLQVKIRENLFWYREGAVQKYVVRTGEVQEFTGRLRHPYLDNGRAVGLTLELANGSQGRWRLAEDVLPGAQVADVTLVRQGRDVKLQLDGGQLELTGVCDELGNLHGEVVYLNHRSGHFVLLPAVDDVTVRCPRNHAMTRMSGLGKRRCSCDICGKSICRAEPLFFTCHPCNYDTCGGCCGARLLTRLPAEHPVHLSSWAPLHFAAAAGHTEVARLLLDAKANATAKDVFGRTPLHWAAAAGLAFMVEMLANDAAAGGEAAAQTDAHGFIPLKLVPPEMLRFAGDDREQIHGNAVEVGRPEARAPGEPGAAGLYTLQGERDGKPLYKRTDGPGWAVCWDKKTSRWGLYREKYEPDQIQYENKSNTAKCPVKGWVSVAAADPAPSFEEALPWRVGNMLLAATPEGSRPRPYDLKAMTGGLPPLDEQRKKDGIHLTVSRTADGGITITLPGGDAAPSEMVELLIMEMIRRGDLPPEPPPGCVMM